MRPEVEVQAPRASSKNPGIGLELSVVSERVSEAPTGQEAALSAGRGTSPNRPDPRPSGEGMRLTPAPPAQAKAAHGGGETPPR